MMIELAETNRAAIQSILEKVRQHHRFLITSHENPDGDGIGSSLALGLFLMLLGKDVVVHNADSIPYNLRFLPGVSLLRNRLGSESPFEVTFILDAGEIKRLGDEIPAQLSKLGSIVNIDHHLTFEPFGHINWIVPEASSTGELIYYLIQAFEVHPTQDILKNIYSAILTDTGSFHYQNATPNAFLIAGEIIKSGVDPWEVAAHIFEKKTLAKIQMMSRLLNEIQVTHNGQIAECVIRPGLLKEGELLEELSSEVINHARSIEGVEVAILFREKSTGKWKISFRSRNRVNVAQICQQFNGGGHYHAAGCEMAGDLTGIYEKIMTQVLLALTS